MSYHVYVTSKNAYHYNYSWRTQSPLMISLGKEELVGQGLTKGLLRDPGGQSQDKDMEEAMSCLGSSPSRSLRFNPPTPPLRIVLPWVQGRTYLFGGGTPG